MKHYGLKSNRLIVKHMSTENGDVAVFQKVLERNENMLSDKENKLMKYELELVSMRKNVYPVGQLMKELAIQFTGVATFSIVNVVYANAKDFSVQDTIPTAFVVWKDKKYYSNENKKLEEWIKVRLSLQRLKVYETIENTTNKK